MVAQRSDGIEEEPFEFEEEEVDLGLDEPEDEEEVRPTRRSPRRGRRSPRPSRASPRRGRRPPPVEDDYYDEDDEYYDDEDQYYDEAPASSIAGLPPQTVKIGAAVVIALAVIGVVAALWLRSSARDKEEKARVQALLQKGVTLTYKAAHMAVAYFASPEKIVPPEFNTYFHSDPRVVDVVIQHQPAGSVTFYPVAFALKRKIDKLSERPRFNPKPIPGTEVYDTRGTAVIDMVEYPIRVFRQNIKDENGNIVGRVAVMLFEPRATR